MGIVMPETCWAVSVRQNNKILRLIVASSWVFYLSYFIILGVDSDGYETWVFTLREKTWLKDVWEQNGEQNIGAWESNKNIEKITQWKAS